MSELRECPFCGGNAQRNRTRSEQVCCSNTECSGWLRWIHEDHWQTRPTEDALRARVAELEDMNLRWKKAVEGLTPQGSEYVNDPERCAEAIRYRCQYPRQILDLQKRVGELEATLKSLADGVENPAMTINKALTPPATVSQCEHCLHPVDECECCDDDVCSEMGAKG